MFNNYKGKFVRNFLILGTLISSYMSANAQLSGSKTIPTDYATINDFVTDLNLQGVGPGGVTFTIPAGYSETAPAGGYVITATGTSSDPIVITGGGMPKPVITASSALTAGALNDGIFVLVGSDYVTLSGLQLQENAANTTTAAASNNMTEWGIALLYATTTNGAQNNTIQNNTISLNRTYQNTFGIYANATHTLAAVTTAATATSPLGSNSGLVVHGNAISNVNNGILVVGPTGSANHNDGIDIGGTTAGTGNTLTNYGTTGTFSSYANVSGSVFGILVRNSKNFNISNNSVTSSVGGTTSGTLRGIFVPAFNNAPTGTFSNVVTDNVLNLVSGSATAGVLGISVEGTSASVTSSLAVDDNTINGLNHAVASSGAVTFISQVSPAQTVSVSGNTFSSLTAVTSGSVTFLNCGYTMPTGGSQVYNNNVLSGGFTKTTAGGTVTVFTTGSTSPGGTTHTAMGNSFSGISVTGSTGISGWINTDGSTGASSATKNITGNTFSNWTSVTGTILVISQDYGGAGTVVSGNTISNISGQAAITGISIGSNNKGALHTYSGNTISGLTSSGTGGSVIAISNSSNAVSTLNITNNTISSLSTSATSGACTGITASATNTVNISGNTVSGLVASGTTPAISGIVTTGSSGAHNVFKNKVYGLSASGVITNTAINAIALQGGVTVNAYNNVVGNLTAPVANAATAINGIQVSATVSNSNYRVVYNTVYINASSTGTNFGTTGIFHTASSTATTAALDLRNNIVINESVASGTGLIVAYRRSGTALNNYASTSNRNLFYAGTPSASNLVFTDGTTPQQTLSGFQAIATPREANSITGESFTYASPGSFFISLTGSSADYLKPVAGIMTLVESGAGQVTTPAVTDDYASVVRAGNTGYTGTGNNPDLGAYEFEGTALTPVVSIAAITPAASTQCTTSSRQVVVNITTVSGTITDATLNYAFNGIVQTPVPMVNTSGSTWEATIPASVPVNAAVTWSILANSSVPLSTTYTGTGYQDEPLFGYTASVSASETEICNGVTVTLETSLINGAAAPAYALPPAVTNPTSDEDLVNVTLTQGATVILNNTSTYNSLTGTLGTATGTTGSYSNFTAFGPFDLEPGATYGFSLSSFLAGTFGNSMAIYIDYNRNGVFTDAGEQVYAALATTAGAHTETGSFMVPVSAQPGLTRMRVINHEGVITSPTQAVSYGEYEEYMMNILPTITAISWSDGVSTVGMGSPLDVTPSATTTYTASITSMGCVFAPAPAELITVNPLPSNPATTNSTQCGAQVPSAAVTSTSGLPTPVFNWYDQPTGGTLLQSSSSGTYTTTVTSTTTFHVAEADAVTGCESNRVPVTVTVIIPDAVAASVALTPVCEGEPVSLMAINTNPTPVQNYTYTWSGPAGSGAESGVTGASVTVMPTIAGSYTYLVTAVDGICSAIDDVVADINPIPSAVTASTLTPVVCNGDSFDLEGSANSNSAPGTITAYAENFDAGIGSWTTLNAGSSPAVSNWAIQNAPFSYPSYFAGFSTAQGGGFMMTNADAGGSGSYTNSQLISPVFSTVGMTDAAISFENLYQKWTTGDDIVRIEISTDGGSSWTVLKDYLVPGSQGVTTTYAQVPASESIALPAMYLDQSNLRVKFNYQTDWGYYWVIDNFAVTGNGTPAGNFSWSSIPAGFSSTDQSPAGIYPTTTTDYILTVTNSYGCEASATTQVTVVEPTVSSMVVTECIEYTLNGTTYTASGMYVQNLMNVAGCDSTLTLDLTITQPSASTIMTTECGAYVLNGNTYTVSGTYLQVIPNMAGCDSTITLDLTITPESSTALTIEACNSYTHGATTYNVSGLYTQTYTSVNGCDSVVTIDLTIYGPAVATNTGNGILAASAGLSYQWINCVTQMPIQGATFQTFAPSSNGTYAVIINNGGGCLDTSACVAVTNLDIRQFEAGVVSIYPNPTSGVVHVSISTPDALVEVLDIQGKKIETVIIDQNGQIDLSDYERGTYLLRIKTEQGVSVYRVVRS